MYTLCFCLYRIQDQSLAWTPGSKMVDHWRQHLRYVAHITEILQNDLPNGLGDGWNAWISQELTGFSALQKAVSRWSMFGQTQENTTKESVFSQIAVMNPSVQQVQNALSSWDWIPLMRARHGRAITTSPSPRPPIAKQQWECAVRCDVAWAERFAACWVVCKHPPGAGGHTRPPSPGIQDEVWRSLCRSPDVEDID